MNFKFIGSNRKNLVKQLVLTFALLSWTQFSSATLIGDSITFEFWNSPTNLVDSSFGVAGTDDLTVVGYYGDDFFTPTFSGDIITIELNSQFSGESQYVDEAFLTMSGLDWGGTGILSGVTLLSTEVERLLASNLSFTASTFTLQMAPGRWVTGDTVQIELIRQHVVVTAPATLALFGLGLAGLGWSRRKEKAKKTPKTT